MCNSFPFFFYDVFIAVSIKQQNEYVHVQWCSVIIKKKLLTVKKKKERKSK